LPDQAYKFYSALHTNAQNSFLPLLGETEVPHISTWLLSSVLHQYFPRLIVAY
jgi:hypothetical protein